ncbi:hypothetical protein BOX15_Mlig009389g2 [Macrostomum lignano]|uniref:Uncharacterized protein n=1 Tax=Macrostomum lignano TaxID=282301 RepID=A0A267GIA4_9PLAT|nr:hypothetical protein BOX15_Mlig009389g1 [Macrostomum lignano]PAA85736.1 hypothetical protein BOX15_Mlig009389g2 [Macrostomum lignano]
MHFIVRRAAAAPATKAPPTQPPSYAESAAAKSNNSGGSSGFDIFLVLIAVFSVLNIGLIIAVIILSRAKNQSATARSTSQTGSGRSTRIGSVFEDSQITQREERISWKLEKYFREPR